MDVLSRSPGEFLRNSQLVSEHKTKKLEAQQNYLVENQQLNKTSLFRGMQKIKFDSKVAAFHETNKTKNHLK